MNSAIFKLHDLAVISEKSINHFEIFINKKLDRLSQVEIFLFSMIYGWLYIVEHNTLEKNKENAQLHMLSCLAQLEQMRYNYDMKDFMNLYKTRSIEHRNEIVHIIESSRKQMTAYPQYFYRVVDHKKEIYQSFNEHTVHLELSSIYIELINDLKIELDKAL